MKLMLHRNISNKQPEREKVYLQSLNDNRWNKQAIIIDHSVGRESVNNNLTINIFLRPFYKHAS